jgi:hypothetical protein
MSRRFWPCQAGGHAAMARSRIVSDGSGTIEASVASMIRPRPWHVGQAPCGVLGEKSSACSMSSPRGYSPAREYSIRTRFDSVVTLPTDERVVGAPRCCWSATAGGSPSMASTSGTPIWWKSRRA